MSLSKKYVVQKSFRIDAKLENDLELLAEKLGRTQNDLANLALEMLMQDNRVWFMENILVDSFYPIFEGSCEDYTVTIADVMIRIYVDKNINIVCTGTVKNQDGTILDKWNNKYKDDDVSLDELKLSLRQLAISHLINNKEEMDKYLKTRLDYR